MGQSRTLENKIVPSSVPIAKTNAAKPQRMVKYMHAGGRLKHLVVLQQAAKLAPPNRAS